MTGEEFLYLQENSKDKAPNQTTATLAHDGTENTMSMVSQALPNFSDAVCPQLIASRKAEKLTVLSRKSGGKS